VLSCFTNISARIFFIEILVIISRQQNWKNSHNSVGSLKIKAHLKFAYTDGISSLFMLTFDNQLLFELKLNELMELSVTCFLLVTNWLFH